MNGKKYPRAFEIISENFRRLQVPGGWIVFHGTLIHERTTHVATSESICFVPDINHEWHFE